MAGISHLLTLSDESRKQLETCLTEFEQSWTEDRLAARIAELPLPGNPLRLVMLLEMVRIDLSQHWRQGRRMQVEGYLQAYPELGASEVVAVDLIQEEYELRRTFGAPADLADFARRFPHQAEALRQRLHGGSGQAASAQAGYSTVNPQVSTDPGGRPAGSPGVPEQFGRYRVGRCLGRGGMGSVYLAHDTQLERPVALKVPHFTPEDGPEVLEHFVREARSAALIQHPNICPVYDVGEVGGIHYVTMAYIEGRPLSDLIKSGKPLPQRPAAAVVRKLALALQEAHGKGIIHRDLKPANVMINQRKEPIVMDFGLARRVDSQEARLTRSGAIMGTPAYMSPEQVSGDVDAVGPASDVYSLGVILYELLTGRLPFDGPVGAVLGMILTQQPSRPSAYRPDLEPALEAVCVKAMAKQIRDRYASMADLAGALTEYLHGKGRTAEGGADLKSPTEEVELLLAVLPADPAPLAPAPPPSRSDRTPSNRSLPPAGKARSAHKSSSARVVPVAEEVPTRPKRPSGRTRKRSEAAEDDDSVAEPRPAGTPLSANVLWLLAGGAIALIVVLVGCCGFLGVMSQ